jgi:hypothetical protein
LASLEHGYRIEVKPDTVSLFHDEAEEGISTNVIDIGNLVTDLFRASDGPSFTSWKSLVLLT